MKEEWRIKSTSYYGDTLSAKVYCPNCTTFLSEVKSNVFGENVEITEE